MVLYQVDAATLKILQHFALDLFNIGKVEPRNFWKQRLVLVLSAIENELIIRNIQDDILILLKTRNSESLVSLVQSLAIISLTNYAHNPISARCLSL
jgi:hypothetical protein